MFENVHYLSGGRFISRGKWIHPDRIIDSYEVILVISGEVYINSGGKDYELRKNSLLILEPNVRHFGFKESTDTSFYWMHWSCDRNIFSENASFVLESPHSLTLLFNQLINYSEKGVLQEMLDCSARLILGEIYLNNVLDGEKRQVNNIAEWVRANRDIQLKTVDVADHFGYNSDYVSRLFKKTYKKSLKEYIDDVKIEYIKDLLLNTNVTLYEAASLSGFEEYKYFLKFFKYHAKMTPTEFCNIYSKTHINNR